MKFLPWLFFLVSGFAAAQQNWVERSNHFTSWLMEVNASYWPESYSHHGMERFDDRVQDLGPDLFERRKRDYGAVLERLKVALAAESHPNVRLDLEILIQAASSAIEEEALFQAHYYPYFDIASSMYMGIAALVDAQADASRRPSVLVRLNKYAGLVDGAKPLAVQALERTREGLQQKGLRWPLRAELERDIGNADRYLDSIEGLLKVHFTDGWHKPMALLRQQTKDYYQFLRTSFLPHADDNYQLPRDIYAFYLRQAGTTLPPRELIARARLAFMEIRAEMQTLAALVAEKHGFEDPDYRHVISQLKKKQLTGQELLTHYRQRILQIQDLIREHQIFSLPDRPLAFRLATEAESLSTPSPHMSLPRLIDNQGEHGTFVLPLRLPPKPGETHGKAYDDYTYEAASWSLAVHEGRPGHELQFETMLQNGVSTARVFYAYNSVNIEGWALYCEAIMKPYYPLEGQLVALRFRLKRAARAFLDPLLQLGDMQPQQVKRFLMEEVLDSEASAEQEVERYMFRDPGQATAYFYGYTKLMGLRAEVEMAMGKRFNQKDFHDYILSLGLLPPDLIRNDVLKHFQ